MGDGAGAGRGGKGRSGAGRLCGRPGQVGSRAPEARSGPNGLGASPGTCRTLRAGDVVHRQRRAGLGVCALAGGGLEVSVLSISLLPMSPFIEDRIVTGAGWEDLRNEQNSMHNSK